MADIKLERKLENMVWGFVVKSVCSAVLTVYKFLFVKLLLPQELFQKKKQWVEGVEDMEFPGGLQKQNLETPGVNKKELEFPGMIKKKQCGISMGLGFWPWKFQ